MVQTLNYGKTKADSGTGRIATGTILPWSKATAPEGFLKCDGTAVSRTIFSDLFAIVGTTYGVGDGSTTFNLPNLTSRMPVGANTTTNVGQTGGAHDTTGAGFAVTNNLTAQNTQNLGATSNHNVAVSVAQNLSVQATQNLATQTTNNLSAVPTQNLGVSVTQNLAGSASGSVSNHTLSLAQIPSHSHPGQVGIQGTRSAGSEGNGVNVPNNLGSSGSNQAHGHSSNFAGSLTGNVAGNVTGTYGSTLTGNVSATIAGDATSAIAGSVGANMPGNITTNITGNVATAVAGDVQATNVSLYEPHLVVIYIIKT